MSVLKAMPKSDMVKKLDVIFIKMKKLMGKHIGLRYAIILYYPGLWLFLGCGVPAGCVGLLRCNGKRTDVLGRV